MTGENSCALVPQAHFTQDNSDHSVHRAAERLVVRHDSLIEKTAVGFSPADQDTAGEIAQLARISLWSWARRRRPTRCSKSLIRLAVKRAVVDEARERRRCGLAIAKIDEIDEKVHRDALLVEGEYEDVVGRKVVARFIASQPLKIRAIYCGLYRRGLSQRELAFRLEITQPRVAQIHEELLRRGRAWFARAVA